jgi:hypothetical protein
VEIYFNEYDHAVYNTIFMDIVSNCHPTWTHYTDSEPTTSSLAKGYDPLYSPSPLASLDGFSRSHGDGLYVMQLVVAATNQNALYKKHMFCRKNIN